MAVLTIKVADETLSEIDALARRLDRPQSEIIELAITDLAERENRDLAEIEAGLADAQRDDFASDEEVSLVLAKYAPSRI
ncbi:CopG family ribbon-helix-helix protein [Rhizobium oryzicola]|uniref:Ribbon-helix-helix protein, CopG family n=1 Tax=Rhizobium oryzicola TaxID=1232668 RepID=A0ABT8T3K1_9HYPH|nr:ribbon-helix-helix protein, CopG family [Rhizobium oryzicola]MDO1584467.1 ribbon-helix-helix protein, CopG family [Rhizobium oryzicola]